MDQQPHGRAAGIIDTEMLGFVGGAGLTATVLLLRLLFYILDTTPSITP